MNMKKLIESMDHIEECGIGEGPMGMAPPAMAPEMDKGNPVTVNVNMNASGKEHVADLLDMMKNAGLGGAEEVGPKMLSPRMDMERLSAMMDEPEMENTQPGMEPDPDSDDEVEEGAAKNAMMDDAESMDKEDFCEKYMAQGMDRAECEEQWNLMNEAETEDMSDEGTYTIKVKGKNMDSQDELARLAGMSSSSDIDVDEAGDYANEPDPQYGDMSDAIPDGNDLNRKKKAYPATQDGDNPMAVENIKAALYAALTEKKAKPDFLDVDKDGDKKEPMKKALKDKKTTEGRGKLMAGRGRGKKK
tara:strand:+ start:661 stop:1569 length:909 start_codon:yes stop_codon:yes gene_type:complete